MKCCHVFNQYGCLHSRLSIYSVDLIVFVLAALGSC